MATASCAHISAYWISVAAIAGVFCPKKLVATSAASRLRLAAITGGGTVMANAVSYAPAAGWAWPSDSSACSAVAVSHSTKYAAAAVIDSDDGPDQAPEVSSDTA